MLLYYLVFNLENSHYLKPGEKQIPIKESLMKLLVNEKVKEKGKLTRGTYMCNTLVFLFKDLAKIFNSGFKL